MDKARDWTNGIHYSKCMHSEIVCCETRSVSQYIHEKLLDMTFRVSLTAFFQGEKMNAFTDILLSHLDFFIAFTVNTPAAEVLLSHVRDWCDIQVLCCDRTNPSLSLMSNQT